MAYIPKQRKKIRIPCTVNYNALPPDYTVRHLNVFLSKEKDQDGKIRTFLLSRGGLSKHSTPAGATAKGRGIYYWNSKVYSVFGNAIYSDTTSLGVTLDATSGYVGWAEIDNGGVQYLVMCDGTKAYRISTSDVVTTISTSTDADFPSPHIPTPVFLDGYLFLAKTNGDIYNSDLDDVTSWNATNYITAEQEGDNLVGLKKLNNYLIALGTRSVEFFYNNANISGSPLSRNTSGKSEIGLVGSHAITLLDDKVYFIGKSSTGEITLYQINGFEITPIYDIVLNKYLSRGTVSKHILQALVIHGMPCIYISISSSTDSEFLHNILFYQDKDVGGTFLSFMSRNIEIGATNDDGMGVSFITAGNTVNDVEPIYFQSTQEGVVLKLEKTHYNLDYIRDGLTANDDTAFVFYQFSSPVIEFGIERVRVHKISTIWNWGMTTDSTKYYATHIAVIWDHNDYDVTTKTISDTTSPTRDNLKLQALGAHESCAIAVAMYSAGSSRNSIETLKVHGFEIEYSELDR